MKKTWLFTLIFAFPIMAYSQDCQTEPQKCVLVSREVAIKALEDSDKVKALESHVKTLETALNDQKTETNKIRFEFAECKGQNTGLQQNAVENRAIITVLLQNVKKKRNALITIL